MTEKRCTVRAGSDRCVLTSRHEGDHKVFWRGVPMYWRGVEEWSHDYSREVR